MHKPVQGKTVITSIAIDIKRDSFPDTLEDTYTFLCEKYLNSTRAVVKRNLTLAILRVFLSQDEEFLDKKDKLVNCLMSIYRYDNKLYKEIIISEFGDKFNTLEDDKLTNFIELFFTNPEMWDWFDISNQIRLKKLIETYLSQKESIVNRFKLISKINSPMFIDLKSDIETELLSKLQQLISEYIGVSNYRYAEELGREISTFSFFMNEDLLKKVIESFKNNGQIQYAHGTENILIEIYENLPQKLRENKIIWQDLVEFLEIPENYRKNYDNLLAVLKS